MCFLTILNLKKLKQKAIEINSAVEQNYHYTECIINIRKFYIVETGKQLRLVQN